MKTQSMLSQFGFQITSSNQSFGSNKKTHKKKTSNKKRNLLIMRNHKTRIKSLLDDINNPALMALLTERLIYMMEITMHEIQSEPEKYIVADLYKQLNDLVNKHLTQNSNEQ